MQVCEAVLRRAMCVDCFDHSSESNIGIAKSKANARKRSDTASAPNEVLPWRLFLPVPIVVPDYFLPGGNQ